jgi:uncharacterized protein with PhoU and TrkA domain
VVDRLAESDLTVGDLLRHPLDREEHLELVVLMISRGDDAILSPAPGTPLQVGDKILLAGTAHGLSDMRAALYYPATLEYVVTGRQVPTTWLWRKFAGRRQNLAG